MAFCLCTEALDFDDPKTKKTMRNLLLSLTFIFSSSLLSAQFTGQGNFVIGSTFGLATASSKVSQSIGGVSVQNPTSTQLSVAPSIGYFIMDDLAIGIGMGYTFNQVEQSDGDSNDDSDLLFGPFARYYLPVGTDMAFFLEGVFGFGNTSNNLIIAGAPQQINTNILSIGIGPGFTIFSNSAFAIEALTKYNFARSKFNTNIGGVQQETIARTNKFDLSLGLRFYIGGVEAARASQPRLY